MPNRTSLFGGLLSALLFVLTSQIGHAQTVDLSLVTGFVASPLTAGSTDQYIFGVQLRKNAGGANTVTGISVLFSQDPAGILTNARLFRSTDATFDGGDPQVATGTLGTGPNRISFTGAPLTDFNSGDVGVVDRWFFILVDVDPSAGSTTIQPSATQAQITVGSSSVNAATVNGTNYTINALETSISSLNAGANNVAGDPLIASSTNNAVFGFSLVSNGSQSVTQLNIQISSDPALTLSGWSLVRSADTDFATANTTIGGLTFTPSATELVITGLSENVSSVKNYFLVATVDPAVTGATPSIQASLGSTNVTTNQGGATGNATGIDYGFAPLTITAAQVTGGIAASPLGSSSPDQALIGFSLSSNGNPDFTGINMNTSSATTGKFNNVRIFRSTDNTFDGGDVSIGGASITLSAGQIQISSLSETLSSTPMYYFLVADVAATVNGATASWQLSFTQADIQLSAGTLGAVTATGTNYSFQDSTPPAPTFNPANGAINVSIASNLIITFDEPIRKTDASAVSNANLNTLVELRLINSVGVPVSFSATIDVAKQLITIDPTLNLLPNTLYYLAINPIEDIQGNESVLRSITFTTELPPNISNFVNATNSGTTTSACANDVVTINGSRFGVAVPTITINGTFVVAPADILSNSNNQIQFTLRSAAPNGNIVVTNNDNGLSSTPSGSSLTVLPAINTGIGYILNPSSPVQGNDVMINLPTAQNNLNYVLIKDSGPGANGTIGTENSLPIDFTTGVLSTIGTYVYHVTASRTECTTRNVIDPLNIIIAALTADAGADRTICVGEQTTLGGTPPAFGGSGFFAYKWESPLGATISTAPNPKVTPAATRTYFLTITDNLGATATSSVNVTVNATPTASFQPDIKNNFSNQDPPYLLDKIDMAPVGGTLFISGLGVSQQASGFYFDPKAVGTETVVPIYLKYTVSGCSAYDTVQINVSPANAILGLESYYCTNRSNSNNLTVNPTYLQPQVYSSGAFTYSNTYTFKRLGFYSCDAGEILPANPNYPITPLGAAANYTLNVSKVVTTGYSTNCFYVLIVADLRVVTTVTSTGVVISDQTYPDNWPGYGYFELAKVGAPPAITSIREDDYICSDASPIQLITTNPAYTTNSYTINDGPDNSISMLGPDYYFDPSQISFSGQQYRSFMITYDYNDNNINPAGGCQSTTVRNINVVNMPPAPVAPDQTYCQDFAGARVLSATSNEGSKDFLWYDTNHTTLVGKGSSFDTKISTANPINKTYYVRQILLGCQGLEDDATVIISPAPSSNLNIPPQCEERPYEFIGPTANVDSWTWDLGDGTTASTQTVTHAYKFNGAYNLSLELSSTTNGQVCVTTAKQQILVGKNPKPNFKYNFVCDGDATLLSGSADNSVVQYEWIFGDMDTLKRGNANTTVVPPNTHGGKTGGTYKTPTHTFTTPSSYTVELKAFTNLGCYDSITKVVTILPYLTSFNTNSPYEMAAIDGGKGFWTTEDFKDSISWEFAAPTTPIMTSADPAWVTNATGLYKANDASAVNSPCLDISNFQKPTISFDFIYNTEVKYDGAVLEYSINNGAEWKKLGDIGTGQNWFNTSGFFSGKIGDSNIGWSGTNSGDTWKEGKHALDNIILTADRNKVRFRIAFGSNADGPYEGFAFKNVMISERNRTLLFENFTNENAPEYPTNNTKFMGLSNEGVKIQYHVPFPQPDANSPVNTQDPSARAAFYGIAYTDQNIPRVYVDGYSNGSLNTPTNWYTDLSALRSLKTSPFLISIETLPSGDPGALMARATITSLQNFIPIQGTPIIQMAIVEKTVGINTYVLRKLLPNATGTKLPLPIAKNATFSTPDYTWQVSSQEIDASNLALVVFVQDEVTREVYQAAILENPANLPSVITGVENQSKRFAIFPNPSTGTFSVTLAETPVQEVPTKLFDSFGKEVLDAHFKPGESTKTFETQDLADGIYFLQLKENGTTIRKKLIIVH